MSWNIRTPIDWLTDLTAAELASSVRVLQWEKENPDYIPTADEMRQMTVTCAELTICMLIHQLARADFAPEEASGALSVFLYLMHSTPCELQTRVSEYEKRFMKIVKAHSKYQPFVTLPGHKCVWARILGHLMKRVIDGVLADLREAGYTSLCVEIVPNSTKCSRTML